MAAATVYERMHNMLGISSESGGAIYSKIASSADLRSVSYWLELLFAAGIATLGLVQDSPAVVIGAMLISPLMGPILAIGLALAAADLYLGVRAVANVMLSIAVSLGFSAFIVWLLPFQNTTGEILARTEPNLLDLVVALLSGLAGALVVCRGGGGGGVTALPGVAVAVALMPPLCTAGFAIGSHAGSPILSGAGLLFLTNLAAITASAFFTFLVIGMDAPEARIAMNAAVAPKDARGHLIRSVLMKRLSGVFGGVRHLYWRILMLVAVLGALFVPLRESFIRLRDETNARNAANAVIRAVVHPDTIVSRQIEVRPAFVAVRLVVTGTVPAGAAGKAERELVRRTGKDASFSIRRVAGEEELAYLREHVLPPVMPSPEAYQDVRDKLLSDAESAVTTAWPSTTADMRGYELAFSPNGTTIRIRYDSTMELNGSTAEVLANVLRAKLNIDDLQVELVQEQPPQTATKKSRASKAAKQR